MPVSPLSLVDESPDWLVVDKPAGLVCHPTKDGEWSSLIGRVRLYLGHGDGRLVNRLDRETSGLVLVAKHREAARDLGRLLADAAVEKSYVAIVHGRLSSPLVVTAPLGRDEGSAVAIKDGVRADGAAAETRVEPVSTFLRGAETFSTVHVTPRTGPKHQIRIHLAHAGFPIVGDKIYGGDEGRYLRLVSGTLADADRQALLVPHHALHAARLACTIAGRHFCWQAPEPARLGRFRAGEPWARLWADVEPPRPDAAPEPRA
jgi:23S rRNA pseudouridine1911/1915/1917 synthase